MNVVLLTSKQVYDCQQEGRDPYDYLLFNKQVARIRTEAHQIARYASAIKGLTTMDRVNLRASADDLEGAAKRLRKIAQDEERDRLMGCYEMGDLSTPEFFRAMRHLGIDEAEIEAFVAQFEEG